MSEKGLTKVPQDLLIEPNLKTTDHELLILAARQRALGLRIKMAELVGVRERTTATAITIGATLVDMANLFPIGGPNGRVAESNISVVSDIMHSAIYALSMGRPLEAMGQLVLGPPIYTALEMIQNPIGGTFRAAIGIGSVALTGIAIARWLNVGNVMRNVLEFQAGKADAPKT